LRLKSSRRVDVLTVKKLRMGKKYFFSEVITIRIMIGSDITYRKTRKLVRYFHTELGEIYGE